MTRKWYRYTLLMIAVFAVWAAGVFPSAPAVGADSAVEGGKYVALTFDDGPIAATTGPLLDGLKVRGAKATFFVVGSFIPWNEELLLRIAEEGHQIGQHTYSHIVLEEQSAQTVRRELQQTDQLLRELLGEGEFWLRPPYGRISEQQYALSETPLITWTVDPEDWRLLDAKKVRDAVLREVESGDVILMHDIYQSSVEAALMIVDELQKQGYRFVTVRELMELQGVTPAAGELYRSPTKPGRGY